jgi:hypothetical protein
VPRAVPGQEVRIRSVQCTAQRVNNAFERTRVASGMLLLAEEPRQKTMNGSCFGQAIRQSLSEKTKRSFDSGQPRHMTRHPRWAGGDRSNTQLSTNEFAMCHVDFIPEVMTVCK